MRRSLDDMQSSIGKNSLIESRACATESSSVEGYSFAFDYGKSNHKSSCGLICILYGILEREGLMWINDPYVSDFGKCETDVVSSIRCIMVDSIPIGNNFVSESIEVFIVFEKIDIMEIIVFTLGDGESIGR